MRYELININNINKNIAIDTALYSIYRIIAIRREVV